MVGGNTFTGAVGSATSGEPDKGLSTAYTKPTMASITRLVTRYV